MVMMSYCVTLIREAKDTVAVCIGQSQAAWVQIPASATYPVSVYGLLV